MLDLKNVHSLTDFQRNTKECLKRLKKTGEAELLTVNGEAEVVVQSASSYQELLDDAELVRSLRAIRRSLDQVKAGKVRPAKEFFHELAAKHGIKLD